MDDVNWTPAVRPGAWAAVDVGLLRHRKLAALRGRADVLYLACVLHCAEDQTDGRVRSFAVRRLLLDARARRSDFDALVSAGLLEPADDGDGWTLPGYLEWNAPRSYRDRQRAQSAQRQARFRAARRAEKGPANGHSSTGGNELQGGGSNGLRNAGKRREDIEGVSKGLAARTCPDCETVVPRGVSMEDHRRISHGVHPAGELEHRDEQGDVEEAVGAAPSHVVPSSTSRTLDELIAALRAT